MEKYPPLTSGFKKVMYAALAIGILLSTIGIYLGFTENNTSLLFIGALAAGGATMATAAWQQLFYRPDR